MAKNIIIPVLTATAVLMGSQAFTEKVSAETKLTANYFSSRKSTFYTAMFKPWVDQIEKASNGRIKIFVPTASLAPAPRQWDLVAKGAADIALTPNTFKRNILHLPPVAELPFHTYGAESSSVALNRTYKKYFAKANEYKDMHLLVPLALGGFVLHSLKNPITKLADLNGMKMQGDPGFPKSTLQALGATAVVAPGIKIFEMMSKGVVDGAMYPFATTFVFRATRYVKHATEVPGQLGNITFSLIMNKKVYDGLSPEDRKIIDQESSEKVSRMYGQGYDKYAIRARQEHIKAGTKIIQASPELISDVKAKLAYAETDWVKRANKRGVDGAAALQFYRDQAKMIAGKK